MIFRTDATYKINIIPNKKLKEDEEFNRLMRQIYFSAEDLKRLRELIAKRKKEQNK